ncbi:MAG: cytidine deaminase, partial [Candidatus Marinimicrobia bacterium]|nr:cytidine deaminase [Candidatus Neomarinimicrobiota bacterium]
MEKLINAARLAKKNSYSPYSKYRVGAAVLTDDDTIISGCNVESSSYSLTCCAERTALFSAISSGHNKFKALAVITKDGGTPCGACRQVIWDLCGDIPIYIADENGNVDETTSKALLPKAFDGNS